jgi:hypothetical protein
MKSIYLRPLLLAGMLLLHGCAVYAVYCLYKTVTEINQTLTAVHSSITRIQGVLDEGENLNRAAEDGRLISTLAEKIPTLIHNEVEVATKEKITALSDDLQLSSLDFTKHAVAEDLLGAKKSYNEMSATYNKFTDLMDDLSDTLGPPVK